MKTRPRRVLCDAVRHDGSPVRTALQQSPEDRARDWTVRLPDRRRSCPSQSRRPSIDEGSCSFRPHLEPALGGLRTSFSLKLDYSPGHEEIPHSSRTLAALLRMHSGCERVRARTGAAPRLADAQAQAGLHTNGRRPRSRTSRPRHRKGALLMSMICWDIAGYGCFASRGARIRRHYVRAALRGLQRVW